MTEQSEDIDALRLVRRVREYEADHSPDGWPAVQMAFLSEMADMLKRLEFSRSWYRSRCELLEKEQKRFGEGKERTLLCDILANGQILPDPNNTRYPSPNMEDI